MSTNLNRVQIVADRQINATFLLQETKTQAYNINFLMNSQKD